VEQSVYEYCGWVFFEVRVDLVVYGFVYLPFEGLSSFDIAFSSLIVESQKSEGLQIV
jgi:hypothetical protein